MAVMLEKLPADLELYFRCRFHSCHLLGKATVATGSGFRFIDTSKMECPKATIESDCTMGGDNWEIFYRRPK